MKKNLPKVFKNSINKPINNNKKVFYGQRGIIEEEVKLDDLFKQNQIYRTDVIITLKDQKIEKKIIGRSQKHLITIDNELIAIDDIIKIEKK